jgi:hypothetical protein
MTISIAHNNPLILSLPKHALSAALAAVEGDRPPQADPQTEPVEVASEHTQ